MSNRDEEDLYLEHDHDVKNFNFHLLKSDNELFNEESNKPSLVVSVRRVKLPRNGEDWHILENDKVTLQLKGTRFTNAEKTFLHGLDGMKFLIAVYKEGVRSIVKIKDRMKQYVKV